MLLVQQDFLEGVRDAMPICLGYFSVSMAFGITAVLAGMPLWAAGLMALVMVINLSGILPLVAELKKRRQEWKLLLEEEN